MNTPSIACGVTTAPRIPPVLHHSLRSIINAGFEPTIFAEPGSPLPDANIPVVQNQERLGCFRNWVYTAYSLLSRETDYVAIFQDDIDLSPHALPIAFRLLNNPEAYIKRYAHQLGAVSFYTPSHYFPGHKGWHLQPAGNLWGALGFLFPREVLVRILNTVAIRSWEENRLQRMAESSNQRGYRPQPCDVSNLDTAIGFALKELSLQCAYYRPSLGWHCAPVSSIKRGSNEGRRQALDRLEFLPSPLWEREYDLKHYKHLYRLLLGDRGSVIHVASGHNSGNQFLSYVPHLNRTSLDTPPHATCQMFDAPEYPIEGINYLNIDFEQWIPTAHFDIALCFNPEEHFHAPDSAIKKLLSIAHKVYIMAPYEKTATKDKLLNWAGMEPWRSVIIKDPLMYLSIYKT